MNMKRSQTDLRGEINDQLEPIKFTRMRILKFNDKNVTKNLLEITEEEIYFLLDVEGSIAHKKSLRE